MHIPSIAEYLLSLSRPNGSKVAYVRNGQTVLTPFPTGGQINNDLFQGIVDYADIIYGFSWGAVMVPNAFTARITYAGGNLFSGIVTATIINEEHTYFIVRHPSNQVMLIANNVSGVPQYFELNMYYLAVPDEDSFKIATEAIARWGTSANSERLLKIIAREE